MAFVVTNFYLFLIGVAATEAFFGWPKDRYVSTTAGPTTTSTAHVSFCRSIRAVYNEDTKSCFKLYTDRKNFSDSQEACARAGSDEFRGRLAILRREQHLNFVQRALYLYYPSNVWVVLRSTVPGSNNVSDWRWFDGNTPVAAHTYGELHLNGPGHDCARLVPGKVYRDRFHDYSCSQRFRRLCEFVEEAASPTEETGAASYLPGTDVADTTDADVTGEAATTEADDMTVASNATVTESNDVTMTDSNDATSDAATTSTMKPSSECRNSSDCPNNQQCINGICKCPYYQIPLGGFCIHSYYYKRCANDVNKYLCKCIDYHRYYSHSEKNYSDRCDIQASYTYKCRGWFWCYKIFTGYKAVCSRGKIADISCDCSDTPYTGRHCDVSKSTVEQEGTTPPMAETETPAPEPTDAATTAANQTPEMTAGSETVVTTAAESDESTTEDVSRGTAPRETETPDNSTRPPVPGGPPLVPMP